MIPVGSFFHCTAESNLCRFGTFVFSLIRPDQAQSLLPANGCGKLPAGIEAQSMPSTFSRNASVAKASGVIWGAMTC